MTDRELIKLREMRDNLKKQQEEEREKHELIEEIVRLKRSKLTKFGDGLKRVGQAFGKGVGNTMKKIADNNKKSQEEKAKYDKSKPKSKIDYANIIP